MTKTAEIVKSPERLVEATPTQTSVAVNFGYTASEVAVIQNTVAKGTTKLELAYFLSVCKTMDLNPFNKEVWCYKDNKGNLIIFAGRDGFLAKAQKNPLFNGIRSSEVRENDTWGIDIANAIIEHKIDKPLKERGHIIGAYALIFRKGGEPTIEWADFDTYNKGYNTWKTHSAEMIKKVAEAHALKKAFGISGIQSEYQWETSSGIAIPNNTVIPVDKEHLRITNHINNSTSISQLEQVKNMLKDDIQKELYLKKLNHVSK
jgi:phage recombination protein Bet